jgi:ADP-ribosylation factor-binding protein GGA
MTPQPPSQQSSAFVPPSQPASDPFASLGAAMPAAQPPKPAVSAKEDEWNFASALPAETPSKPKEHRQTLSDTVLRIEMQAGRGPAGPNALNVNFAFSNNAAAPLSELHFQLAVTKVRPFYFPSHLMHAMGSGC